MFTLWCSVRCGSFFRHTGFADSVHRFLVFKHTHTHLGTYTIFTVWTTRFPCFMSSMNNFVSFSFFFLASHLTNTSLLKGVAQSEYIGELQICLLMWTQSLFTNADVGVLLGLRRLGFHVIHDTSKLALRHSLLFTCAL